MQDVIVGFIEGAVVGTLATGAVGFAYVVGTLVGELAYVVRSAVRADRHGEAWDAGERS